MWLALETSGDRASAAVGDSGRVLGQAELAGARRHAAALPQLIDQALHLAGATAGEIEGIVLGDGPGSFTGLRIGATVAKAMLRARRRPLWAAPSLLALAASDDRERSGALVVAVGDALRGQLFATSIRVRPRGIELVLPPGVVAPDELAGRVSLPDLLVIRDEGAPPMPTAWAAVPSALRCPAAADLLPLIGVPGGARFIAHPAEWEPDYGRPAEAQARWEATHGRRLPDSTGRLS